MTPSKKGKTTHIKIERKHREPNLDDSIVHVAGGQHQGLIVAKSAGGKSFRNILCVFFFISSLSSWWVRNTEHKDF